MRKIQLSVTLETFGNRSTNGKRNKVSGYIDGNNLYEVLQEQLTEIHKIYKPNIPFEDFCDNIKGFNGDRFGKTNFENKEG